MHENAIFSPRRGGVRRVHPMVDLPLLGVRSAVKELLGGSAAEMIYGTTTRRIYTEV